LSHIYPIVRRSVEVSVALLMFVVTAPVVIVAALAIYAEDRSASPLLRQERLGRDEVPFTLFKLRTMRPERVRGGRTLTDVDRLLRTGRIIRLLSIDELPQLVNVLRGEMSLIGPRPMPVTYQPFFTPSECERFRVSPGMSGLAQVRGRNFLSWDQKFAFDVEFVRRFGPVQDIRILLLTLAKVLWPRDVGVRGHDLPVASLHEVRAPQASREQGEDVA
jgi:undecaprenyl phosphate N,N'-diacetylbacillosamine 1-phosphate transferase